MALNAQEINVQMKVISKITGQLLHQVVRCEKESGKTQREDICAQFEGLQLAKLHLQSGQTFKAHKHNYSPRVIPAAQESWVVISGKVTAFYYDLDGKQIMETELCPGDVSITFAGGHNYRADVDSYVYEFKTGPYYGHEVDKTIIH